MIAHMTHVIIPQLFYYAKTKKIYEELGKIARTVANLQRHLTKEGHI